MRIKIDYIAKSEGHTGMEAKIINGKVRQARIDVKEGARLIEGILKGRKIEEAPIITSRICGICPVVHNLTSIKAMEAALGLEIPEQIVILRKLMLYGQIIQSHILHIFMAISDYFECENAFDLRKKHPKRVKDIFRIRKFANQIIEVIGGRAVHPVASVIGGFTKRPDRKKLKKLLDKQEEILDVALGMAELFKEIELPEFPACTDYSRVVPKSSREIACLVPLRQLAKRDLPHNDRGRKTEFIALKSKKEYAVYEGNITSTQGLSIPTKDYKCKLEKLQRPSNVVNLMKCNEKPYMVGALARINLSHDQLNKEAKKIFKGLFNKSASYNPFYNLPVQMIEVIHFIEEAKKLLKVIFRFPERTLILFPKNTKKKIPRLSSQGVGAIEAPRGTLYHSYKIDKNNRIIEAKIITPTAQFLLNLEKDLEVYIPTLKNLTPKQRRQRIEMLVRAYDLCISCAVH
jgi:coenzyme F420-reducing hydrogenase alpha subunit